MAKCEECGGNGFIEHQAGTIMVKCVACVDGVVPDEVVIEETTPIEASEKAPHKPEKPKPKRRKRRAKRGK